MVVVGGGICFVEVWNLNEKKDVEKIQADEISHGSEKSPPLLIPERPKQKFSIPDGG
jgi:hypothetical protein